MHTWGMITPTSGRILNLLSLLSFILPISSPRVIWYWWEMRNNFWSSDYFRNVDCQWPIVFTGLVHLEIASSTGPDRDTQHEVLKTINHIFYRMELEKGLGSQIRKEIQFQCFPLWKSCLLQSLAYESRLPGLYSKLETII